MTKVYKLDSQGRMRYWEVELDGTGRYCTHTGIEGGARTTSGWTTCKPKNLGKKNETTASVQAMMEAQALLTKKTDTGWTLDREEAKEVERFEPMLAQKYTGWRSKPKDWTPMVFSQPKLDGIRCIARADGLWTRSGKPITSMHHVRFKLEPFFEMYPDAVLDGELYNHECADDFNRIVSLVRRDGSKMSAKDLNDAQLIQYHIYDSPSMDGTFSERWFTLQQRLFNYIEARPGYGKVLVVVSTTQLAAAEDLDRLYSTYMALGYEGQMVRLDKPYEQKRSKTLLKRKEFLDEEFEIVRVEEGNGNWAGFAKRIILKLDDGREFGAGLKGDQEFAKGLLERAEEMIGTQATVRFFTPTPDGIPRFPVVYAFHEGSRDT